MPERLAIRPGLTGWAQVNGGRELTASDKAALDLWYIKNASLRVDLTILVATARMIVFGERTDHAAIHQAWRELGQPRLHMMERYLDCAHILPSKGTMAGLGD
jgi:hypothetical protein